jgi:leucyl aminopeptidase (aminopeptidase T)
MIVRSEHNPEPAGAITIAELYSWVMLRARDLADVGLAVAAQRLIELSLGIVPGEEVLIVHDAAHDYVVTIIAEAVREARGAPILMRLEELGARPHASLHPRISEAIALAQASLLIVDFHKGELQMRTQMIEQTTGAGLRHGHIVGVARASMVEGFSVDPRRIAQKARELLVRLKPDTRITVRSDDAELVVQLAPRCRWVDYGCIVGSGKRVNLPGGELVTSPESIDGVYVANGTLGDADGALNRLLRDTPVTLRIAGGRAKSVECPRDPSLARAILARFAGTTNLDRVGLVSFGVNLGLTKPVGDVFSDQKIPGVHLSFGDPFPTETGAAWTCRSWLAFTSLEHDADIDKLPVLRGGRYIV